MGLNKSVQLQRAQLLPTLRHFRKVDFSEIEGRRTNNLSYPTVGWVTL